MTFRGYLTIKEAAKILRITPLTLRNWDNSGRFKAYRHPVNRYRLYKKGELEKFRARGLRARVEEIRGYKNSIRLRVREFSEAKQSVDVLVGPGATTEKDPEVDRLIQGEVKKAIDRGVRIRFIRDLTDEVMRERAQVESEFGASLRHFPIRGVNITIRDGRLIRIELPLEGREQRLNILVRDAKIAEVFEAMFEGMWEKAIEMDEFLRLKP